jgi:signal transduction histidine kinase
MFHDLDPATITDNMLYLWLAVGKIQQVAITLGMLAAIFGHRAKYATNDSLSFLRFSIEKRTVNIMLSMFLSALFAMLNGKALGITRLRLLSMAFFLIGVFLCLATAVRISLMLFRQAFAEKQFRTHHHVSDFMYTFGFASFIIIGIFFSVAAARAGGSEAALLRYLISFVATQVFLICIVSVIPGVKFQRLAALRHEQLETRLNLIRYVSHEMRTPLNTVTMGMKILKEEMMAVSGIKTTSFDYTQSQASLRPSKPSFQGAGAESKMENLHQSSNTLSNSSARINSHGQGQSLSEKIVLLSEAVINRSQFVQAFHDMLETVQQVSESCNVAVSTLDDLLTFDKIDENKLVIEVEELNPWRLLLETAKPFTINASLKNIKFRINLLEQNHHFLKTFCVRGDAFKLAQVIRNLLSNAIKFTPENGNVDVTLRLNESVERGRCVRFSVKDSGAGISKQNMKKLFGQYVQFNAAQLQKGKGSGLGLWITKSKYCF